MQTDLITYLMQDKDRALAALLEEKTTLEERLAAETTREVALLQEKATLEERLATEAAQRAAAEAQERAAQERLAAEAAQHEAALAAEQAARRTSLQQAVEDAISARFPDAPLSLTRRIRAIADPARLQSLIPAVITAADLAAVEALLA